MSSKLAIGVLISGRGSNMAAIAQQIQNGTVHAKLHVVISNNAHAKGLETAASMGIPTHIVDPKDFPDLSAYEAELVRTLQKHNIQLVVLAGYMKLLGPTLLDAFPNQVINIHPSLLPAFKGLRAQQQALDYGVRISGCTVHFVDLEMDAGPIIDQRSVPVLPTDTPDTLSARILVQEHALYGVVIHKLATVPYQINGREVMFTQPK